MSERITESLTLEADGVEERTIKNVLLVGLKSRNGYAYSEAALKAAVTKYSGKPVYLDHARDQRTGRSTRDLAGSVVSPRIEPDGIRGDVKTLATEAGKTLLGLAEDRIEGVGMSHVVVGVMSKDRKTVESIEDVLSVDAVSRAATTKSFFEEERVPMDLKTLKEQHPELVKQIEEGAAQTALQLAEEAEKKSNDNRKRLQDARNQEIEEARKEARAEAIKEEKKRHSDIRALCETAKLPELADKFCEDIACDLEETRRRLFEELCKRYPAPGVEHKQESQKDEDAAHRKEYRENAAVLADMGLTEEQFVNSRRKDEGKPPLPAKK